MSKGNSEHSSFKLEENESAAVQKPPLFQRWKAHMKKWWWLYLIGLGCVVLVTVLPIAYVGVPRFANDRINKYDFDFDGLSITNPTPNSFHIRQSQQFHVGMGSGHLSEFDASMHYAGSDTPFAVLPFPRIDFGNDAHLEIDQDLELSCVSCFSKLAEDAVRSDEISVQITGKPTLKVQALPTAHLDIHKTVALPGLNVDEFMKRDDAFNVTKLDLIDPPKGGYNVNATLVLNTPTTISVEMVSLHSAPIGKLLTDQKLQMPVEVYAKFWSIKGAVSFNLTIDDSELGYIDIPDMTLRNGTSTLVALGNLDIKLLIRKGLWESSNSNYGKVTIGIHGNRSVYNGEEIPYFTAAVKAISASTTIDLFDYVSDFLGGL